MSLPPDPGLPAPLSPAVPRPQHWWDLSGGLAWDLPAPGSSGGRLNSGLATSWSRPQALPRACVCLPGLLLKVPPSRLFPTFPLHPQGKLMGLMILQMVIIQLMITCCRISFPPLASFLSPNQLPGIGQRGLGGGDPHVWFAWELPSEHEQPCIPRPPVLGEGVESVPIECQVPVPGHTVPPAPTWSASCARASEVPDTSPK